MNRIDRMNKISVYRRSPSRGFETLGSPSGLESFSSCLFSFLFPFIRVYLRLFFLREMIR